MGIGAEIFVRERGQPEIEVEDGDWRPKGATRQVKGCDHRYWAPHYRRGDWPHIAAILMELLTDPMVETVWYFGDDAANHRPFTKVDFIYYTAAYLQD